MAQVDTIVVGGGIAAAAPFTLNGITFVANTDPASISTTDFISVVPTGATRGLIVGAADPDATATERLRVSGGLISEGAGADSTIIGRGAAHAGTDGIAIGRNNVITGAATGAIAIGNGITGAGVVNAVGIGTNVVLGGSSDVVIGNGSSTSGGSGVAISGTISGGGSVPNVCILGSIANVGTAPALCIGGTCAVKTGACIVGINALNSSAGTNCVALGNSSQVNATGGIAIGNGAVVASTNTNSIAIGNGAASFAANQLCIGSNVSLEPINTVVIGHGKDTQSTPTGVTIRLTNASGLNNAAGNLTMQPGLSTGTATPGDFRVNVGAAIGSSSTLQTAATRLAVRATTTAADTWLMIYDVDNATLERVSVGAADSGGAGFKVLRIPN